MHYLSVRMNAFHTITCEDIRDKFEGDQTLSAALTAMAVSAASQVVAVVASAVVETTMECFQVGHLEIPPSEATASRAVTGDGEGGDREIEDATYSAYSVQFCARWWLQAEAGWRAPGWLAMHMVSWPRAARDGTALTGNARDGHTHQSSILSFTPTETSELLVLISTSTVL